MLNTEISEADLKHANMQRFSHPDSKVQKKMHILFLIGNNEIQWPEERS